MTGKINFNRRSFLKLSGSTALLKGAQVRAQENPPLVVDDFERPDSPDIGDGWKSLNPGYWKIQKGSLRRRLKNVGDGNPVTWFPWHWETHRHTTIPLERDLSLPYGMIWRRDWTLHGNYTIEIELEIRQLPPYTSGNPEWRQFQPGYSLIGICFGSESLYESWSATGSQEDAQLYRYRPQTEKSCWFAAWRDNGCFGLYDHQSDIPRPLEPQLEIPAPVPSPGTRAMLQLEIGGKNPGPAQILATLQTPDGEQRLVMGGVSRTEHTNGYFGLVTRGLMDVEVKQVSLRPGRNARDPVELNELHVCYPLGDSLRLENGAWKCLFVALCRNQGERVEIKVSDSPLPEQGWGKLESAGSASLVSNHFRRNTSVIEVTLPSSPAEKTLYYTVWKDGRDVTPDPREGFLGKRHYVGRLPRLKAPYRLCGLSCHAIVGNRPELPEAGQYRRNWIHDQPTPDAFRYLEKYEFQVMLWEDDIWYLELIFAPPSIDDAYKVVTTTLAGPTTRWQMMRHWNVLNPGDHDYGMDDIKGPEQILMRKWADLGQDPAYLQRNYQMVAHLTRGEDTPGPLENPRRWRRWKMPDEDFSLLVLDSRLWRSSQDTRIWDDEGWEHKKNPYDRTNVTRALLGEEQFSWLEQVIRTDSSPLICVTGINGLHTIWAGWVVDPDTGLKWNQRDRVAADYAGWVKAGADRVIRLLGSRDGIITVYGDVHNGCILRNLRQRLYECCFGPIGRYGGRAVKEGFGPRMTDYDGRELEVRALYHQHFQSPDLEPITGPGYWNFLEMIYDPRGSEPEFALKLRNIVDAPEETPRGGGFVEESALETGRSAASRLPHVTTLPQANILVSYPDGRPIRGTRSLTDGTIAQRDLVDVPVSTRVVVQATSGTRGDVRIVTTVP